jgi:hypothetical protein
MHSASIRDAARRLEEAGAIFRFKARSTRDLYGEVFSHWSDARSRKFAAQFIEPQHGMMDQGERICQAHSAVITAAHQSASSAETEISAFRRAEDDFEHSASEARSATVNARNLAARADSDSAAVENEIASLNGAISSAMQDPGW